MDIELLRTIGAPLLSAVVAGLIVHFGARRRDKDNDRRRQRVDYLVEAYRALARSSQRELSGEQGEEFESAVDDILLFGDQEQIELSRQMIESFAANGTASLDTLLVSLRKALRRELGQQSGSLSAIPTIRIRSESLAVSDRAEVRFQSVAAKTAQALLETVVETNRLPALGGQLSAINNERDYLNPVAAIDAGYGLVLEALQRKVPDRPRTSSGTSELSILAKAAAEQALVGAAFVRTAEGLDVLRALAHDGSDSRTTSQQADEYLSLVSAALYVISASD